MLKYGFIADPELLHADAENYVPYIKRCGEIKREIVKKDPTEKGLRKILNFGHTIGHAIESYCLTTDYPLLHGEAVVLGMAAVLWLSVNQCGLDETVLQNFENQLPMLLSDAEIGLSEADIEPIMGYLAFDKKNKGETPRFVLLESVGKPVLDVEVDSRLVSDALSYVLQCASNNCSVGAVF